MKDLLKSVEGVSVVAGGGNSPSLVLLESDIDLNNEEEEEESEMVEVRKPSFIASKGVSICNMI